MSTDEYVPSEDDVRLIYVSAHVEQSDPITRHQEREADRAGEEAWAAFLARVRRDAAREALDGLIEHARRLAREGTLGPGTAKVQSGAAIIAEEYRDTHHPEETP